MAKTARVSKNQSKVLSVLRGIAIGALGVVGLVSLVSFTTSHWVEEQILTPETWAQTMGELPQNDQVASAISSYAIDELFTAAELETTVQNALPEKAAFLAKPITQQLQNFLTTQTKNAIQSTQFQTIWMTANRVVVEQLVNGARNQGSSDSSEPAQIRIPLGSIQSVVTNILKNQGIISEDTGSSEGIPLVVNLKTSIGAIQQQIRVVDFLNATLWLVAIVAFLGAIVLAKNRRRVLIILALSVVVIALLQLTGIRALRPALLGFFADSSVMGAAGVVYDTLLAGFRDIGLWILGISAGVLVLLGVTSPRLTRKSKTITKWVGVLKASKFWQVITTGRQYIAKGQWYIVGVSALVGLTLAAFFIPVSWQSGVLTVLTVVLIAEVVQLVKAK